MKNWPLHIVVLVLLSGMASCNKDKKKVYPPETGTETGIKTLIFSKTSGYRHETAIAKGIVLFQSHAAEWELDVSATESTGQFTGAELNKYKILVLLHTTGDFLNENEQEALRSFVHNGGRILAIHAAADAEYDWPWYNQMLGAWFLDHPAIQQANCLQADATHLSGKGMPATWTRTDEWYNFKDVQPHINVVYSIDESSYSGGTNGAGHPISWYHTFEGGKIFYRRWDTRTRPTPNLFLFNISAVPLNGCNNKVLLSGYLAMKE